jgi:hypothetical protein
MTDTSTTGAAEPTSVTTISSTAIVADAAAPVAAAEISVDGTEIHITAVITNGPDLFALFDQLCPLARELYGNHSGLYREKLASE